MDVAFGKVPGLNGLAVKYCGIMTWRLGLIPLSRMADTKNNYGRFWTEHSSAQNEGLVVALNAKGCAELAGERVAFAVF